MLVQSVFKAGNSDVVAIPAQLKKKAGIKTGTDVVLDISADGSVITITKKGNDTKMSSITPQFIRIVEGVNKRYSEALTKLAKL